jgi:predicted nucleic acid-binding protein
MSIVYFDASGLLRLLVDEPGSDLAAALWNRADTVVTSRLSDAEIRAVLTAGERAGRLSAADAASARDVWKGLWPALRLVEVAPAVADRGAALAEKHALRGTDGVHLASALVLAAADPVVAIWDNRLAEAATAEGLRVLP